MPRPDHKSARIIVGIPTFARPAQLHALLGDLCDQATDYRFSIVVADNDPTGSAQTIVSKFVSSIPIEYFREPKPGVVCVRNAILRRASCSDYLIFLDDDQRVGHQWLETFLQMSAEFPAEVLSGRTEYYVDARTVELAVKEYFETRSFPPDGALLSTTGTGNTLIPISTLSLMPSPWFDETYSRLGGEDTDFFQRLSSAGGRLRWCDGAVARELIPLDRASRDWINRRARRSGTIRATMLVRNGRRRVAFGMGVSRLVVGSILVPYGLVRGGKHRFRVSGLLNSGLGFLRGSLGLIDAEYGRREQL